LRERTIYVTTGAPEGAGVRNMVAAWSSAGIVKGSLWVTPENVIAQPSGPPLVSAVEISSGEQRPVDLFTALGTHALTSVRLVVVHLITSTTTEDVRVSDVGRILRKEILAALPRRAGDESIGGTTRLRLVNVLIPVSGASQGTESLLMPGWDVNVVVSPEDRPDLDRSTVFVRHPGNFVGHASAALAALGGLLEGMDQGALDHLELDSTTRDDDLLVARFTVRSVVGDDIIETLAEQTFDLDFFGPDGPASLMAGTRVAGDPVGIAERAAQHVLASEKWQADAAPPGPSVATTSRGLWRAIRHAVVFNVRMFGVMLRWFVARARRSAEHSATRIIIGEDAGIDVRIGAGPADGIAEAAEAQLAMVDAQYKAASVTPHQQLVHVNPAAWTLVREMATALVDGSDLPEGFPEPRISGRRELVPPLAVVPAPETVWAGSDGKLVRALDVRGAKAYEAQLSEKLEEASGKLADREAAVKNAEITVAADRAALEKLLGKPGESASAADDAEEDASAKETKAQKERKRLEASLKRNEAIYQQAADQRDQLKRIVLEFKAEQHGFAEWREQASSYMRTLIEDRVARLDELEKEVESDKETETAAPPRERLLKRQKVVRLVWTITSIAAVVLLAWSIWADLHGQKSPVTLVQDFLGWSGSEDDSVQKDDSVQIDVVGEPAPWSVIAEHVAWILGVALLVLVLANHAFYRAVRRYEWALALLIARRRAEIDRAMWRQSQLARLAVQENAMNDWGRIIAEVVHHPWGDTARNTRELAEGVVDQLPASMGVAGLSKATDMPFQSSAAAVRAVYVKGWLSRVFENVAKDFDDVEIGNETGFSAVDADTTDRPSGPRRRFMEHVEDRTSRRSATETAMRRFRSGIESHEIPIPTRTVRRRGPFTDDLDVDEPGYFSAAAAESIAFASDGFTAVGLQRLVHYVARAAVWLPTSVSPRASDPQFQTFQAHGANAVRVDLSKRVTPADLVLFGTTPSTRSIPLVDTPPTQRPDEAGEVWV
jgi:hypothetical protein